MASTKTMYHLEYAFYRKGKLSHHAELATSDPKGAVNLFLSDSGLTPLYTWTVTKQFKDDKGVQLENRHYHESRLLVILNEMVPSNPIPTLELTVKGQR
jgi:hypothetical protein